MLTDHRSIWWLSWCLSVDSSPQIVLSIHVTTSHRQPYKSVWTYSTWFIFCCHAWPGLSGDPAMELPHSVGLMRADRSGEELAKCWSMRASGNDNIMMLLRTHESWWKSQFCHVHWIVIIISGCTLAQKYIHGCTKCMSSFIAHSWAQEAIVSGIRYYNRRQKQ